MTTWIINTTGQGLQVYKTLSMMAVGVDARSNEKVGRSSTLFIFAAFSLHFSEAPPPYLASFSVELWGRFSRENVLMAKETALLHVVEVGPVREMV